MTPEQTRALVDAGATEPIIGRAEHVLSALMLKPHDALTQFDILEAVAVLARLVYDRRQHLTLLHELSTARPLLLFGDAWLAKIHEVLKP